jgi:hypothetical protein
MVLGDTGVRKMRISPYFSAAFLAVALTFGGKAWTQEPEVVKPDLPKKIFAHYMGCYPVGAGATHHIRSWDPPHTRYDSEKEEFRRGGKWRNWPLVPTGPRLGGVESADLEIRRALRGGIDGFAVDAWAGGDNAKKTLDYLFTAAEACGYPFEITICLDPTCLSKEPDRLTAVVEAIKYVLDRHGESPNLARRDGKPLIFGYLSGILAASHAANVLNGTKGWENRNAYRSEEVRSHPEGWKVMFSLYDEIERRLGRKLYFHICIGVFFNGINEGKPGDLKEAAAFIARRFPAVGEFLADGDYHDEISKIIRAQGAEWCEPSHYQYLNFAGRYWMPKGTEMLRKRWERARENGATLIQFSTWNDYTEMTNLAPSYNTNYAVLDLNRYFIDWWKSGRPPQPEKDKVYLFHRKYPDGAPVYPFKAINPGKNGVIEVVTILTEPATVRLPWRKTEYKAPVGLHVEQFELTPGRVVAEVLRDGKVILTLESPEPVTDRPYREDLGLVGFSTEFAKHWKADFGDTPPFYASEYGDIDNDGLPNWFEMYWFGEFLNWGTATVAIPGEDPNRDGKTNLEHYLGQTDPTRTIKVGPTP